MTDTPPDFTDQARAHEQDQKGRCSECDTIVDRYGTTWVQDPQRPPLYTTMFPTGQVWSYEEAIRSGDVHEGQFVPADQLGLGEPRHRGAFLMLEGVVEEIERWTSGPPEILCQEIPA